MQQLTTPSVANETSEAMIDGLATPGVAKATFEVIYCGLATPRVAKRAEYGFEEENAAINHPKGG